MNSAKGVTFNAEQREFLRLLIKKSKARLIDSVLKSQCNFQISIHNQLNQTLQDVCTNIINASKKPMTFFEYVKAFIEDGVQFVNEVIYVQKKGLLETMMQELDLKVDQISSNPVLEMQNYVREVFSIIGSIEVGDEQRRFTAFLFQQSEAKLRANMTQSQRAFRTFIMLQLNETLQEECSEIIENSKRPLSQEEQMTSFLEDSGVQFINVVIKMQEEGLIKAMMKEADPKMAAITSNPVLELKIFIDEAFRITETYAAEPPANLCSVQ